MVNSRDEEGVWGSGSRGAAASGRNPTALLRPPHNNTQQRTTTQTNGANAKAVDAAGWFRTGDIAALTPSGALRVVDRRKNLFKLSQGEYVAPERLEAAHGKAAAVEQVPGGVQPAGGCCPPLCWRLASGRSHSPSRSCSPPPAALPAATPTSTDRIITDLGARRRARGAARRRRPPVRGGAARVGQGRRQGRRALFLTHSPLLLGPRLPAACLLGIGSTRAACRPPSLYLPHATHSPPLTRADRLHKPRHTHTTKHHHPPPPKGLPYAELCADPAAADWLLGELAAAARDARLRGFERVAAVSECLRAGSGRAWGAAGGKWRDKRHLLLRFHGGAARATVCSPHPLLEKTPTRGRNHTAQSPHHPPHHKQKVRLSPEPFAVDNGLMTPTFKLKRPQLRRRFAAEVAALYTRLEAPTAAAPARGAAAAAPKAAPAAAAGARG